MRQSRVLRVAGGVVLWAALPALALACFNPGGLDPSETRWPVAPAPTTATLTGMVLELGTDAPIAGARVEAGAFVVTTRDDGRYNFDRLAAGTVLLQTTHPRFEAAAVLLPVPFTIGNGEFRVRLRPIDTVTP